MRDFLRKFGRFFIDLKQGDGIIARQSVLLVDGSFILPNNFALIIRSVKDRFKNARITVLTFEEKKEFIRENFPEVDIIVPNNRIKLKKYRMAIQLFLALRGKFRFVILSSLDISLVLVSLIFSDKKILLHNKWMEWYALRRRTVLDILQNRRSDDNRNFRNKNGIMKAFLKRLGRIFVILSDAGEEDAKCPVLIVDNGYTNINHILTAVREVEEKLINPRVTLLTFEIRKNLFEKMLPRLQLNIAKEASGRYCLAREMLKLRKSRFERVVITSLDISPIAAFFLFMNSELLLYNKWHQWWSVNFKNIFGYARDILNFLFLIPVFLYLFITSGFILLRTGLRAMLINFKGIVEKEGNRRETV